MIELLREELDYIAAQIPGGRDNVQDVYSLSPHQSTIFFKRQLETKRQPYLIKRLLNFPDRRTLDQYLEAAQQVVDRHDILRTAFFWKQLTTPVQVVFRHAALRTTEVVLDPHCGPVHRQLNLRFDSQGDHVDLTQAPLIHFVIARDPDSNGWLALFLSHEIVDDYGHLENEIREIVAGRADSLPTPQPFRKMVDQLGRGYSQEEDERFFGQLLGDIDEPTAAFGVADVCRYDMHVFHARLMLPDGLTERLRIRAAKLSVTVSEVCHFAWALVLARTSGRCRVVFGTASRFAEVEEYVLGPLSTILPFRLDFESVEVEEAVRQTHATLTEVFQHEHASLALAQRCSGVRAPAPLFSAVLNYRHNRTHVRTEDRTDDPLHEVQCISIDERTNYPIVLSVDDFGDSLGLAAQVISPLSPERICSYMQHALERLLHALEHAPRTPINQLDVLPPDERTLLLETWNQTEAAYPQNLCIHQLFEEQVQRAPEAIALQYQDISLTYSELNAKANRLAHHLIALGVRPDDRVALCLERSPQMLIALLAILKAGGAYLPLDPASPSERLLQILTDATPRILISDAAGCCALGQSRPTELVVLDLDASPAPWSDLPDTDPDPKALALEPHHLAYVIYTSGSTGAPKGVMVEHHNVVHLAANSALPKITPSTITSYAANPAFGATTWEIWGALVHGATLVVIPSKLPLHSDALENLLRHKNVNMLHLPAGLFNLHYSSLGGLFRTLDFLMFGGDLVDARAVAHVQRNTPPLRALLHCYGQSETTTFATTYEIKEVRAGSAIPIGRPIANARIYLLDAHRQPVPLGAIGEIYIGGAGVARGYLNRPELTAERFLPDPFSPHPGARMYRSGDLGRYRPDGNLEFLGRNDQQVKIRGFRIEPGEIEACLLEHPAVREALVLARKDSPGEKRLVAYLTTTPGQDLPPEQLAASLRAHLGARLPEYMIPAAFVHLDALPLTPNGKLDRKALPAPESEAYARQAYEAPQGHIEQILAALWEQLLGVSHISRHDNFFELGGHSLLAVRLMGQLRRLGLSTDVGTVFTAPTLAEFAATLGSYHEIAVPPNIIRPGSTALIPTMLPLIALSQADIDRIVAQVPGGIANIKDIYALSPLQDGILFHHLLAEEGDPYLLVVHMAFPDRGLLDRYLQATQEVINRHDILRTAFFWKQLSTPAQVVLRQASLNVTEFVLDPRGRSVHEQLARRFDPRANRVDLRQAPLLRFSIASEPGSDRWFLVQLLHHLIGDHATLEILHSEVSSLLKGQGHTLSAPRPFRTLIAQARLGISQEEHELFFRRLLGDIEEPTAPFGLADVHRNGSQVIEARRMLPQTLNEQLRARARRLGISLASLCHLAWGRLIACSSGRDSVVFGTVLLGRMQAAASSDQTMGLFINTLPLRLRLEETEIEESVRHTHVRLAELLRHEHASLALAQRCSGVRAPAPLFSAVLNYRHNRTHVRTEDRTDDPLHEVQCISIDERTNYPIVLSVDDFGDSLGLAAQVISPLSPERICSYMQHALERLLHALEHAPRTPINQLDVLPPDERTLLLETWNQTEAAYPQNLCIHQLFEEQVQRAPEAIALQYQDISLTYSELNAKANRLAHHLIALGVRPDDRVALCLERSPQMLIALLAILKAGGAYLPLDPASPSERLLQILTDATPRILISDAAGCCALGQSRPTELVVLDLDASPAPWSDLPDTDPDPKALALEPHHLAYVIYTSGSTGEPKGVMVPHRAVNRLVINNSYSQFDANDRIAFASNPAFDAATLEVWGALLNGGILVIIDRPTFLDPRSLAQALQISRVTRLWLTAGMFSQIAPQLAAVIPQLKSLIIGGDVVDPSVVAHVLQKSPPKQLVNGYGPTETTTFATTYEIKEVRAGSAIPIGRPIANARIYLLDAHRQPVPLGAIGEIYIGGAGVARGYLNRPELTAERFLPDPFSPHPGARMYRSGDLGRYRPDGNLEFLGRNDQQVKIRGFRIEPGEIEACLLEHPAVREALVLAREDSPGEKRLVAYLTTTPGQDLPPEQLAASLRAHLGARLPEYMIPAAFVHLDALPLTPNGKLDRKALPAPESEAYARQAYEAPQGHIEQILAALWEQLLGVSHISRQDDFFELGGHSLLAVRLLSRLPSVFGIELSVAALFAHPTLGALAAAIDQAQQHASVQTLATLPPITPGQRQGDLPLSFAQQRMWFLAHLEGVSQTYHIPMGLQLHGPLDVAAWQRSLDALFARHEALRSVFVSFKEQPHVELLPSESGMPLIEHDLRGAPEAQEQLKRLCAEEATTPFDLARGPLIRARLIRLADQEHLFLLTQHHIVSDGWSMGILIRELSALYRTFSQGQPDPLAPLPIQYPDYALWQRQYLTGERLQAQAQYWRENLTGAPDFLELPTDRPRPPAQSFEGAYIPIQIDAETTEALKRLSQRHGTTLFMTLLAAWAAVLARLSGQDDLVFGIPTANRNRREIEPLIGLFVNTLALRIDLSGTPSVAELLSRVRQCALTAQDHQDLPFEQVVEIVQPPRRLDRTPLFQVMFAWQNNNEAGTLDLPDLTVSPAHNLCDRVKFDLELDLWETSEGIVGTLRYATALFDAATLERQIGYLHSALRAMLADTQQPVARLPLLSPEERTLLLQTWNQTEAPYPEQLCIHQLFEQQVERAPGTTALVYEQLSLSYYELNTQANRIAHYLIALGVRPDDRVALCLERSPQMVIGLLAILKAGGAYLPLDPAYPSERLTQILTDATPRILLCDAVGRCALGQSQTTDLIVLDLDASPAPWSDLPDTNPDPKALTLEPHHLAYIIYTSGSTGTPKGTGMPHYSTVNLIEWHRRIFAAEPGSRALQFAALSFDVAFQEIFSTLCTGETLVLLDESVRRDVRALSEFLIDHSIKRLFVPPLMLQSLAEYSEGVEQIPESLKDIIVAGEQLRTTHEIRAFFWKLPSCRLHNHYGPTETHVVTEFTLAGDLEEWACLPPIGRPIANARIYLLDAHRQPVPLGAIGEIYIGGAGVARGYLNRPELTAERFLPDPFSPHPGARMYRSGDLGRYRPDGNLEFLGRNDQQVKIRGFRIEPGEIEACLLEHPAVREALVLAREDSPGEKRLVAYLTTTPGQDLPPEQLAASLRAHLGARLPEYMIPAAFVHLDALPLTPNGKLDRKALPAPESEAYARQAYEAPQGHIEQILAALWEQLLGVSHISRQDDFFELGGHSLLAVRLLSRLPSVFGIELSVAALFAHPTLGALAAAIDQAQQHASVQTLATLPPITPGQRQGDLPLSFAQQRMWFLAHLEGVSQTYHIPMGLQLHGPLDVAAWQRSLDALFARHEALRSVFVSFKEQPHVELLPSESGMPLIEHDLRGAPEAQEQLKRLCAEEATTPFDLARGPLIRARLIRLADQEHLFLLTQHHIVSDGWSMGILIRELSALYRTFSQGQPDPLAPLPIQYPDYALWQRQYLTGERLQAQAQYWRENLTGAPDFLELPTDRPRPPAQSFEGAYIPIQIDAETTEALKRLSQRHGTTLFMTLLAAWAAVLARLSGQDDLVFGIPTANRNRREIEPLIGLFVNTLALRIDLSGTPSVAELLSRVRQCALTAQDHQDLPFEQVVEIVQPPRRLDRTPLFQVMFAWQNNNEAGTLDLPDLTVSPAHNLCDRVKFDLELDLWETSEGIVGTLRYATALFDAATLERQIGYLHSALRAMLADTQQPVARLPLLSPEERTLLLQTWNQTEAPYPEQLCIHQLFEQQVERAPGTTALVYEQLSLSYYELNTQANRIAHYLIALGVRPDDRVALCLERSPQMVIGLLAILKAGGAYLPLDPAYPSERLTQILTDATPRILLCDAVGRCALGQSQTTDLIVLDLDASPAPWSDLPDTNPDPKALTLEPHHLAYTIYTAGSTGEPKGVMVEHRNFILSIPILGRSQARSVRLAFPRFDIPTSTVFEALLTGRLLIFVRDEDTVPFGRLLKHTRDEWHSVKPSVSEDARIT